MSEDGGAAEVVGREDLAVDTRRDAWKKATG